LSNVALPQLSSILGQVTADLNPSQISPSVQNAFNTARTGVNADYATAGRGQTAYINQSAAQSGGIWSTNQIQDQQVLAAQNLDQQRQGALQNLDFQESAAGMQQFNSLLQLLGQGSGTALGLGGGFGSAQAGAIGGMSNQSPGQGALSGGLAGAGTGAAFGPYGALIGGVLGAGAGYFGSNP
jgi:hypothetical protein